VRDYDVALIPTAVALVAPAVRTLCVSVWANPRETGDGWQTWHEVLPVVALQAVVEASFSRNRVKGRFDVPASVAEAKRTGWGTNGVDVRHETLIIDNDYGLVEASRALDGQTSPGRPLLPRGLNPRIPGGLPR
jgi:hypothetical protein